MNKIAMLGALVCVGGCGLLTDGTRDELVKRVLPVATKALAKAAGGSVDANGAICFEVEPELVDGDDAVYVVCRASRLD